MGIGNSNRHTLLYHWKICSIIRAAVIERCMMIVALDVCYDDLGGACVGLIAFKQWDAEKAVSATITMLDSVADYEPGIFYKRELPCLLAAIAEYKEPITTVVVDAYVDLDESGRAGLGRHLYNALGQRVPVIGVAKTKFKDTPLHWELLRGESRNPLRITAAGVSIEQAKLWVRSMHGKYRMPTLLTLVDNLCRGR